jgi:hypothetical protein
MSDEEMHEAQPEPDDEDDISEFHNPFEGQPDP